MLSEYKTKLNVLELNEVIKVAQLNLIWKVRTQKYPREYSLLYKIKKWNIEVVSLVWPS